MAVSLSDRTRQPWIHFGGRYGPRYPSPDREAGRGSDKGAPTRPPSHKLFCFHPMKVAARRSQPKDRSQPPSIIIGQRGFFQGAVELPLVGGRPGMY